MTALDVIAIVGFLFAIGTLWLQNRYNKRLLETQLKIAKMQNETQIVLGMTQFKTQREIAVQQSRQEWINRLREEIARFQTALGLQFLLAANSEEYKALSLDERLEHFQKIDVPYQRLTLYLNPTEQLHKELLTATANAMDCLIGVAKVLPKESELTTARVTLGTIMDEIGKCASHVLKSEWERVKRGE